MKNMKLVALVCLVVGMFGCGDNEDVITNPEQTPFAYSGVVSGRLYDTVYMSDVTYTLTIDAEGGTRGTIQFGSAVILSVVGTTCSDGNFIAMEETGRLNDIGMPVVGPIVMDGKMLTTDGHVNGGSGHWYSDDTTGNWNTPPVF